MNKDVKEYNKLQSKEDRKICDTFANEIDCKLEDAENKLWHGHPVWFLEGNPIVGYSKLKDSVRFMFWSGQSFDEESLEAKRFFKKTQIISSKAGPW